MLQSPCTIGVPAFQNAEETAQPVAPSPATPRTASARTTSLATRGEHQGCPMIQVSLVKSRSDWGRFGTDMRIVGFVFSFAFFVLGIPFGMVLLVDPRRSPDVGSLGRLLAHRRIVAGLRGAAGSNRNGEGARRARFRRPRGRFCAPHRRIAIRLCVARRIGAARSRNVSRPAPSRRVCSPACDVDHARVMAGFGRPLPHLDGTDVRAIVAIFGGC